jgi:hypothetical protein
MDLPEAGRGDPPLPARRTLTHLGRADQRRTRSPVGGRHDDCAVSAGRGDHLDGDRPGPPHAAGADPVSLVCREWTDLYRLDLVRAVPPQASAAVRGNREAQSGTPAEQLVGLLSWQWLDDDGHSGKAGEAALLLPYHLGLECPLGGARDVLPVAAAASARPGMRAGRCDPVLGCPQHPDHVRPAERATGVLRDPGDDPLPGQRMPDEDDAPVVATHAVAAVRHRADVEFHVLPEQRAPPQRDARPGPLRPTPSRPPDCSRHGRLSLAGLLAPTVE